jgi:hypothetical protein
MKKLSISLVALLAIVFAVTSAFTTMPKKNGVVYNIYDGVGFSYSTAPETENSYSAGNQIYSETSDKSLDDYTCSGGSNLCVIKFIDGTFSDKRSGDLQ